jgi:dTDP-glucose 4,6-dehydratase
MRLLVAGGAGFIGSTYVRVRLEKHPDDSVRVLDKLTYAGRPENLEGISGDRVELVEGDIADADAVASALEGCGAIVNFAAESHVDRSIESPGEFIQTDVFGAFVLLEAARAAGVRHLQVSTDEVYGSIESGSFSERSPIEPSSPYSASKAGGDLIVGAYHSTYGAEALIVRGSNNYGARQHPEKLIPLCVLNALAGDPLPVYGDGMQVRNWIFVEDFCAGIDLVLERGEAGEAYNVGGPDELPNIEVVKTILSLTGRDESLIEYVTDRPGHDRRYSLGSEKARELGWEAQVGFEEGLRRTVEWYRDNEWWWGPIRGGEYREYYERQYGRALGG